jgi:uncharacterized protein (DUF1697 family)
MASVVFLRGVNVGGHKTFRPSALARQLKALDAINVGAAGTLVIRKAASQAALRAELLRRLPFRAEIMICRSREILDLASADPFAREATGDGVTRYVSILAKRPRMRPALPLLRPEGSGWQVKLFAVSEPFVLSLHRKQDRLRIYPNEVVETSLGVPATTRNWSTISAVCGVLERR